MSRVGKGQGQYTGRWRSLLSVGSLFVVERRFAEAELSEVVSCVDDTSMTFLFEHP
jgi:hypothetical protein